MSSNDEIAGSATKPGNAGKNDGPPPDEDIRALFTRLDLKREITVADFLKITSFSVQNHKPSTEKQLAETFLQQLLRANYKARYISLKDESALLGGTKQDQSKYQGNGGFGALFKKTSQKEGTKSAQIHPMDVQMAVFHHADHFLKQRLVTKLSQCQYALPLLVPNPFTKEIEFPLWTFTEIMKSWKIREEQPKKSTEISRQETDKKPDKIISKSQSVCKIETPMVSFFRFSSDSSSKSQLMNSLINEKHNTFFHRNCPGNSRTRLLMDGVVEIAWYCPSGKPTDTFTDCVAFCNLHGDAACYPIQRRIVTDMATINVVFLSEQDGNCEQNSDILQDLFNSPTPLICIFSDDENSIAKLEKGNYKLGIKKRNQADVSEEVRAAIQKCLSKQIEKFPNPKLYFKMEDLHLRSAHEGIKVDIESPECITGQSAALEMMDLLTGKDPLKVKEEFLPCQGKLWHDWSQKNKELYRLKGENLQDDQSAKHKEMREIRRMQREKGLSELMKVFIENFIELSDTGRKYLLKWVGSLLDDFTSETVNKLNHDYDVKWNRMLDLKKEKSENLNNAQKEVEETLGQLSAATFGLEHFLREMGQVYEATGQQGMSGLLPKMAANLMVSGHPIELMDGDAAHVPLVWVTAILDKLIEELGDKRVFVLSVLGIQSSGKSTMLNAMFGLQFAVSAGRCTRGAFMQLVEVSEEMKELLKVDYILVVDTEGLRAMELAGKATVHHDNELATFVVGLGNMTLINIFGENVAEMQDVLQIVVQAFLRMKQVNLNPSCIFVHQNVTDVTAGDKNKEGRRQLQNKLDEMTKLAAKYEVCDAECFSDVIAFDVQTDVKYFAQLWEGSPPMAPPNPSYSDNIQELKKKILSCVSKSNALNLEEFKQRIETLWNALLKEDFVFSFKNIQEITAYTKLEEEYGKWTWSLRSEMQKIEDKLHLAITNETVEIDTELLEDEIKVVFENVKEEMEKYFEKNKAKDILIQWRTKVEKRIVELHDELVQKTLIKLNKVIVQMDAIKTLDKEKKDQELKLLKKSKELALMLKEKENDETKMKAEFDSMWKQWMKTMTTNLLPTKDIDIKKDMIAILSEIHEGRLVKERTSGQSYKSIQDIPDYITYVTLIRGVAGRFKSALFGNCLIPADQISIRELISEIIRKTDELVNAKPVSEKGYHISYMQEIANFVKNSLKEYKPIATKFEFKKEFIVDLSLDVCHRAADKFIRLHKTYKETTDPHTYLEKKKSEYYKVFQQYCTGANCAAVLGGWISSKLREPILKRAYNNTAIDVCNNVKHTEPFQSNKCNLEKYILKSLAEERKKKINNFQKFMKFIQNPRNCFENYIREMVEENMESTVIGILRTHIQLTTKLVTDEATKATAKATINGPTGDANTWLKLFSHGISIHLERCSTDLLTADNYKNINFDLLAAVIKKELDSVTDKLIKDLRRRSDLNMQMFRSKPHETLIEHFCNSCWAKCPFCNATCVSSTDHAGNHIVPIHRADGIIGWYYENTKNLACGFCTTLVSTNKLFLPSFGDKTSVPYNNFRSAGGVYATWTINPDPTELPYWKWFICEFQTELEMYHNKKFQGQGAIPHEWRQYSVDDAIKSLDKYG